MSELVELDCGDPRRSVLPPVAKPEASPAAEEPLLSSHLARVLAAELGAATCFYLLATTVPLTSTSRQAEQVLSASGWRLAS